MRSKGGGALLPVTPSKVRYTSRMCTIVVLNGVRADYPVVLATNRDEFYGRLTSGPMRILEVPRTVGGLDMVKRGTWLGVTREGLFVGVTNQRTMQPPDPSKRSRGELVIRALKLNNRDAITRMLREQDGREYNSFNLMWGDAEQLFSAYAREGEPRIEIEPVPRGVHVLPNDRLDHADFPKVQRAKQLVEPFAHASFDALAEALKKTLADRQMPKPEDVPMLPTGAPISRETLRDLSALCVRTPVYGTRSSSIVALARGRVGYYAYSEGPPDRAPFADVLGLFG
jgi:uncharacterized protein with NRDE domain